MYVNRAVCRYRLGNRHAFPSDDLAPGRRARLVWGMIIPANGLALGVAVVVAAAGCAPRASVPDRPAPRVVPVVDGHPIPDPETPTAVIPRPEPDALEVITGVASYYADVLEGRRTASGEPYDPGSLVAAHRHLPFGTILRVTNPGNGRSVEVRVIDRGPFTEGRVLDVSRSAAEALGMIRQGVVVVRIDVLSYGG
jgi:rare lipoprotein A